MASEPLLDVAEDIDDQIEQFCESRTRLGTEDVLRDIARIVCIANLVQQGVLDGEQMVLCGGMAMRCLDSPRMSVFDGDTASVALPDPTTMADCISYDDDDIAISAESWKLGEDLMTYMPVTYDARFSALAGAQSEFSLSVAARGIGRPAIRRKLNHRYPFQILREDVEVPIMDPDEILAEKVVAWWLFGHAKHYNDIGFLTLRMWQAGRLQDPEVKRLVRALVNKKLEVNRNSSRANIKQRVAALTEAEKRHRLEEPGLHVDPKRGFNTLSYLHGDPPTIESVKASVQKLLVPLLFQN